jgi:hypothetical protein
MLNPDKVAEFGRQLAAQEPGSAAYQAIQREFLAYAAPLVQQFSTQYHDFAPRPDGNVACTMDDYRAARRHVPYVVDTRTGFIWPVDEDVQRGGKYQGVDSRQ